MAASQTKWIAAGEVVLPLAGVLLYIWHWQMVFPRFPLFLLGYLVASFILHGDTPRTLGLQTRGMSRALGEALLLTASMAVVLLGIGVVNGCLASFEFPAEILPVVTRYFAWCLLQQVAMQSFLTNRLLLVLQRPGRAVVASGVMFAAFHLPNPVLVPLTLIGGCGLAWLFTRRRNVLVLALSQTIIGLLVPVVFPADWHHNLRVGPGYYEVGAHP